MASRHRQFKVAWTTGPHSTPRIALGEKPFGTSETPVCPKCGSDMTLRTPWGTLVGESFWGCTHYPRCRGTLRTS